MSPKEHQLSQEVLEFLIEHQDWFMLDVPPPPPSKPSQAITPQPIDTAVVPGTDGERQPRQRSASPQPTVVSSLAEPGWRLVEKPGTMRADYRERERDPSPNQVSTSGRPGSPRAGRGGRRRSSSASGDVVIPISSSAAGAAQSNSNAHVRIASAGNGPSHSQSGSGSSSQAPVYPGASAVAVTRSRTMPARSASCVRPLGTGSASRAPPER